MIKKKSMAILQEYIYISLILVIIGMVYISFSSTTTSTISKADVIACNSFLKIQSSSIVKSINTIDDLTGLLTQIDLNCKKQNLFIETDEKKKVFREIANSMNTCFDMYGSGKIDFLDNFEKKNYCIVCSKINFENKNNAYEFSEFLNWAKENKKDEEDNLTFYQAINFKEGVKDEDSLVDIGMEIEKMKQDEELIDFAIAFSRQKNDIYDLIYKEIDTNQEGYVIYNFERAPDYSGALKGAAVGATVGAGVSYGARILGASLACTFVAGPIGTLVCGLGSALVSGAKVAIKSAKFAIGAASFLKVSKRVETLIRFSKNNKALIAGTTTGAGVGGVGTALYSDKSFQYVEYLNKEEYYRKCGFEPYLNN